MVRLSRNLRRFSTPLSIMTCTDKLRQNDTGFVELSLERMGEGFDLDDFVHALRCNATVKHVCFSGTFVRELAPEQWDTMLAAVGYLQGLVELQIWCSNISVTVFADLLERAKYLTKVYLFRVDLAGSPADFDRLAQALKNHGSLNDLRIGGFTLPDETVSLDTVLHAMAQVKSLEVVNLQLTGVPDSAPFSANALFRLVCSPYIRDLYLSRLGLEAAHLAVLALGVVVTNNLKILDLFGNSSMDNELIQAFMHALVRNKSLETLVLPCPVAEDLNHESCASICFALQHNKSLTTLNLPRSNLGDDGIIQIAQGLSGNRTIRKIEIGMRKNISDKGKEALEEMLDSNYDLERLVVSGSEQSIQQKVEYYLRLNELGRGTLLRQSKASREQWVEMLVLCKDSLDCLYYFLQHNPSLCVFGNGNGSHVIATHEVRPRRRHTMAYVASSSDEDTPHHRRNECRRASAL